MDGRTILRKSAENLWSSSASAALGQPPRRSQRMLRRDARLDVDVREQCHARSILAPHRSILNRLADASELRRKPKFQMLAHRIAVVMGRDTDQPRNS
jgi:hypothetical protein